MHVSTTKEQVVALFFSPEKLLIRGSLYIEVNGRFKGMELLAAI